ncbi:DMT family transporter [Anaerovorax sp. IOR16]|uniref:DMT family transporter n=1 Tax=Anaerovorax sp. IOR16 TaxID=2773458 RepID=UPI001FD65B5F|nr:DMT family transporter [Anaerovorax sp. IOR16]
MFLPIIFLGALLTIKPFGYSTYSIVALFGILAAIFSAAAGTSIRFLGRSGEYHTYEIIFAFMFVSTIVSMGLMWNEFVFPNGKELFYLICIGVVSLLAQVFLTKAFSHENAVVVELVRYIGVVFNALWGLLIWLEIPDIYTIIGGILIVFGCIMVSLKKRES